jgi:tellurite resistance protein
MQDVIIRMTQADIDAAKRIALKMCPHLPRDDDAEAVINAAAVIGLDRMKVIWLEPEKKLGGN